MGVKHHLPPCGGVGLSYVLAFWGLVHAAGDEAVTANSSLDLAKMRAVKYAPYQIGMTFDDQYNTFLTNLFQRDLSLIANQLGADTVRMAPPRSVLDSDGTWLPFLDACQEFNISVLPTFSIHPFLSLGVPESTMKAQIEAALGPFLRHFMEDKETAPFGSHPCWNSNGRLHKAVRGWSIDGLPTLEKLTGSSRKIINGYSSADDPSIDVRRMTKVAMRTMRTCIRRMYGEDRTDIALGVDLNQPSATVGTPSFLSNLEAVVESFEREDFEGQLFDAWIFEVKLPPIDSAVQAVVSAMESLNQTHEAVTFSMAASPASALATDASLDLLEATAKSAIGEVAAGSAELTDVTVSYDRNMGTAAFHIKPRGVHAAALLASLPSSGDLADLLQARVSSVSNLSAVVLSDISEPVVTLAEGKLAKLMIPQIGVAAAEHRERRPSLVQGKQQELLSWAWSRLQYLGHGGLIIDEFSDNWSRSSYKDGGRNCEELGDSPLMQTFCGESSGLLREADVVADEYLGLVAHTNWFLQSCVIPRWDLDVGDVEPTAGQNASVAFTFLTPDALASGPQVSYCALPTHLHTYQIFRTSPSLLALLAALALPLVMAGAWKITFFTRELARNAGPPQLVKAQGKMAKLASRADTPFFDNQLGFGTARHVNEVRSVAGFLRRKAQSGISTAVATAHVRIDLKLCAFAHDPRRKIEEVVDVLIRCRLSHEEVVEQLVRNAWAVQLRILEHHVRCEERCLGNKWCSWKEDTFFVAVHNVWRRGLEGYHLWVGGRNQQVHEDKTEEIRRMFRETLLLYTLQALGEHLLHVPEMINALYFLLLQPLSPAPARGDDGEAGESAAAPEAGPEEVGPPAKGGQTLGSAWPPSSETAGVPEAGLRYDLMCDILDGYIANSDPYGGLTLDDINDIIPRRWGPRHTPRVLEERMQASTVRRAVKSTFYPARGLFAAVKLAIDFRPAIELKSMVSVGAYLVYKQDMISMIISGSLPTGIQETVLQFWNSHALVHAIGHAVAECFGIWNLGNIHVGHARREMLLRRICGLFVSGAVAFLLIWFEGEQWQRFIPPIFLGGRAFYLLFVRNLITLPLLRAHTPFPRLPGNSEPKKYHDESATAPFLQRVLYWLLCLVVCFMGEVKLVYPVIEGLSFQSLCYSRCQPVPWRSECIACHGSMGILYLMIGSMLCVDVFMVHVLFTSIMGTVLGTQRGLHGMRKAPDSAVFLADTENGNGENNPRAGRLMKTVFGSGWRHVWNLMCYRLWKEDLLTSDQADELMQMASKEVADKRPDEPVYLHLLHPVVRERLTFFFASLRTICKDKQRMEDNPPIAHREIYRTHDITPLSQVVPAVNEEVILPHAFLQSLNGENLRWIIRKYPQEWERLSARIAEKDLLNRYLGKAQPGLSEKSRIEVRLWASMRSQTVMRTVQGAVNYHIALEANPTIVTPHSSIRKRDQLEEYVELIWSHQTHGEDRQKDSDVRRLLSLYEEYPIFLVFDLDMNHLTTMDRKVMGAMVRKRLRDEMGVSDDFFEETHFFDNFPFISCKALYRKRPLRRERERFCSDLGLEPGGPALSKWSAEERDRFRGQIGSFDPTSVLHLELVEAMPRRLPLMIGKNRANLTQGKAGNQLMALRFCRGFVVQAMDANMGSFIGEAFKVPMVLKRFLPRGSTRERVTSRLIGFREHIFTVAHGVCGDINAVAEWCFGTDIQRVAAWLGVRMHYGHPDFVDLFWARNRGSMSKATPHINLSEDIYLGFNVKVRGEKSDHIDFIEWEKGREVSFNAASTFLYKISGGNIGVWRSKDLTECALTLPTVDQFSFYFATVGYFVSLTIIDVSVYLYMGFHVLLTLSSVSLHELGTLGSTMSVEWIVGPGLFMYLPPLFEGALEYGGMVEGIRRIVTGFDSMATILPAGAIYWLMTLIFFTFQNKTKSAAVRQALRTGVATYRATGRPNANTRLTLADTFLQYRKMHYQDAFLFLFYYILYRTANMGLAGALPMATIMFSCVCWLIAPTIFAPYPTWANLCEDVTSFYHFLMRCPADRSRAEIHTSRMWLNVSASGNKPAQDVPKKGAQGQPGNLFEVLLADALEQDNRFNYRFTDDLVSLLSSVVTTGVLLAILPSSSVESMELCLFVWLIHVALVLFFGVFLDLCMVAVMVAFFLVFVASSSTVSTVLWAGVLFVSVLDTTSGLLLFCTRRWRKLPGRGRPVTSSNVRLGMKVLPGKDWMYDMKKDDAKQNAAAGCSMVGTVVKIDDVMEFGYCEVLWANGTQGRYRIITPSQHASDLRRHPDWYAVVVESVVLLFGSYHINLLVGFIVMVAHSITAAVLIVLDSSFLGHWHAKILRMPTRTELQQASAVEGSAKLGSSGAPPIAMTELADAIVIEDLKREPWAKKDLRPKVLPLPPAPILEDQAYRGAEWKEVCRIKLRKGMKLPKVSELRHEYGIVAVAVESPDGLECGLDTELLPGGSVLFGFENGRERWDLLSQLLGCEEEDDPKDSVERVWLPVYKFEVPQALTGVPWQVRSGSLLDPDASTDETTEADEALGPLRFKTCPALIDAAPTMRSSASNAQVSSMVAPEMCGIMHADGSKKWFPEPEEILQPGDVMLLSQGSVRNFAMLRARAMFGQHCVGAGFKMVYSLLMPRAAQRREEEESQETEVEACQESVSVGRSSFEFAKLIVMDLMAPKERGPLSCASKAVYRASRMPHLWPHASPYGVVTVAVGQDKEKRAELLFGFEDDVPHEEGLSLFCGFRSIDDLGQRVKTRWLPVFNFRVPSCWLGKSVQEVLAKEEVAICGICRRSRQGSSRELWFPGLNECFGTGDEVVVTLENASAFAAKYCLPPPGQEPAEVAPKVPRAVTLRNLARATSGVLLRNLSNFDWDWRAEGEVEEKIEHRDTPGGGLISDDVPEAKLDVSEGANSPALRGTTEVQATVVSV